MSITETRPEAPAAAARPAVAEPGGLAGWLTTGDHKRIGRAYLVTALLFLVVGAVVGAIVGVERIGEGDQVVGADVFQQLLSAHGVSSVLLFLVPTFVGLATYVVPLQVGAANIAFPRGAATAYWAYLVSGLILLAAYLADGGPGGDGATGHELWALSLIALTGAAVLGLVSVLATVMAMRAPGMTLDRVPLFSWSMLVGGGLFVLSAPVFAAGLLLAYLQVHFGGAGTIDVVPLRWFFVLPHVYLLAVPAAGVVSEVVPVMAGRRQEHRGVVMALLAALAVVGFGAFAQVPETYDDLLYVALGIAALLPVLGLLGAWAATLRRGRPRVGSALLFALGAALMLLLGALAGAVAVIEPFDLQGTVWISGHAHLVLLGAATLGAFAGVFYWGPKIWGSPLAEGAGQASFALLLLGALLLATPDLVSGLLEDAAAMTAEQDVGALASTMHVVSLAGGVLTILGVLAVLGNVVANGGRSTGGADDPWGGHTLEWATTSPPPPGNFPGPVPAVASEAPLLDLGPDREVRA